VLATTAMLRDAADALAEIDPDDLTPPDGVDHQILSSMVDRSLFELEQVREHEWNPLAHNPGRLVDRLVSRRFAGPDERLESLVARLRSIPDALATARTVLRDCPRIHLETAVDQFAGTAALVRAQVPGLAAEVEHGEAISAGPREEAARALDEFGDWLRGRLAATGADGGRDPRLGRRMWEARLWHTLDTELSSAEVMTRALAGLERVGQRMREVAAELTGGPADDRTVRLALDRLADQRPDDATIVGRAREAMTEVTAFVAEHDLVTLVDDPCEIMEMPPFARGVAVAYCDPPGLLETAELPTYYCIAPTPPGWPAERVESFYREYNDHMVRDLTVHEATPGHFLQIAHSRRYRGSSRVRSLGWSGPFVEGWAVYAEEFMADAGFGGPELRMQQLKMQLRMIINAILDQRVHCDAMTEAEAMRLMTGPGFQEEGEAAGKWRRALLTSTQLSTYFVGYTEVAAIAAARPAGTGGRQWHDAMLAHGSPPPRHLRTLLGV
jgi:uncharacterized protein (DUF885 family)